MKVSELIEQLSYLDKDLEIGKYSPECRDGPAMFSPVVNLKVRSKKVYDMDSKTRNTYKEVKFVDFLHKYEE
jgi:hypothetical protein